MKLILDEGMPLSAAAALRRGGVEAAHLIELSMSGVSDRDVLAKALADGAVVATLDADFHQMLAVTGAARPSVIRVRIEGLQGEQMAALLKEVLDRAREEICGGAVVSVDGRRMRVRRLPLPLP